jgi:glycosyltransferase involved in cell wall biosynthesis
MGSHRAVRIGVIAANSLPEAGGGFTFVAALLDAIKACSSGHEFIIWDAESFDRDAKRRWRELVKRAGDGVGAGRLIRSTARRIRSVQAVFGAGENSPIGQSIEQFIRDFDIDFAWFLCPSSAPVSVPYITTVFDLQHRRQPFFPEVSTTGSSWEARERAFGSTLPRASRVITGTQAGKDEIVAFYGVSSENVMIVPIPAAEAELPSDDDSRIDVRAKYGLNRAFLFYPAQFWPHKNHVNLLLALDLLKRDAGVELDLVLTGSDKGNLNHVSQSVAALGLTSQVHILGFVPKADLHGLYREAVCLAYASFFGPDNIPPLEAFALSCPVVAARVPGSGEQLGDAALLFDPADPADIAQAILTVHRDRGLRAELIRRGRDVVAVRSPRAYVEQVCRILDDFVAIRRCWGQHYSHS